MDGVVDEEDEEGPVAAVWRTVVGERKGREREREGERRLNHLLHFVHVQCHVMF